MFDPPPSPGSRYAWFGLKLQTDQSEVNLILILEIFLKLINERVRNLFFYKNQRVRLTPKCADHKNYYLSPPIANFRPGAIIIWQHQHIQGIPLGRPVMEDQS